MPASAFRYFSVGDRRGSNTTHCGRCDGWCPWLGLGPELHAAVAMAARGEETCVDAWIVRALREVVARARTVSGEKSQWRCAGSFTGDVVSPCRSWSVIGFGRIMHWRHIRAILAGVDARTHRVRYRLQVPP